ncbi:hypothetical protein M569_12226, partial [Genlisea aurea]
VDECNRFLRADQEIFASRNAAGDRWFQRSQQHDRTRRIREGVQRNARRRSRPSCGETARGEAAFLREIHLAVHKNLLRLVGFCTTSTEKILVYHPFMQNLSAASRSRDLKPGEEGLNWETRRGIAGWDCSSIFTSIAIPGSSTAT